MSLAYQLLSLLADGKFHSGEDLGNKLQVTRSHIWKLIQKITQWGVEIHSVKGKGYRIPMGLSLLNLAQIQNHLPIPLSKEIHIEVLPEVDSTNQYLLDNGKSKQKGFVVFSEYQSNGRGRRQRTWYSPLGANIYFSIRWSFDRDASELCGLSLATGVAVANTLERYGIHQVKLKWPNDILFNNQKLAGILIEMTGESYSNTDVVIGVGINVQMPANPAIDQHWIDMTTIIGHRPDRNLLAAYLIEEVLEMLAIFQQKGFQAFVKYWQALDAYYNQPVRLATATEIFFGIAKGINARGEFILLNQENKEVRFLHGEVVQVRSLEVYA